MTSSDFIVALATALVDSSQPPPPPHECKRFILEYQGSTADLEVFDHSMWSYLLSQHDRRAFLSMFGIPIDLLVALSADDLLPLLPRDLSASVVVTRGPPISVSNAKRARILQQLASV
jgi:hypothetical protein